MRNQIITSETIAATLSEGGGVNHSIDICSLAQQLAANLRTLVRPLLALFTGLTWLASVSPASAQQDQDNWYLEQIWTQSGLAATNGGLSSAYGVAIGPSGLIYVADQGYGCIQVFQTNIAYKFSITNGFGGGQSFSEPRGMITDSVGNLYVADQGNNCVYEFSANGAFIQKFGPATGGSNGNMSGVMDVAVSTNGLVYIVENGNARLSVFNANGSFNGILVNSGSLNSQLVSPVSVTISDSGKIVVAQNFTSYQGVYSSQNPNCPCQNISVKAFDTNGNFLNDNQDIGYLLVGEGGAGDGCGHTIWLYFGASSVRFDHSGLLHDILGLFSSWYVCNGPWGTAAPSTQWHVFNHDGSANQQITMPVTTGLIQEGVLWPCSAVGTDGTMIFCDHYTSSLQVYRYAKRELDPIPRNAPSMPEVLQVTQRTNANIVDIYYQVNDMDDSNTFAGILMFTNGTQSLSDCVCPVSFAEGTGTNINTIVPTGQTLHVAWMQDWTGLPPTLITSASRLSPRTIDRGCSTFITSNCLLTTARMLFKSARAPSFKVISRKCGGGSWRPTIPAYA